MTFNFDGGDILVIFIVLIALFLFRRLDRTGRSLEKVRKYAEKSKSDLDIIVRERELGLKDLAVDLEVREKTNREILARAEAARVEIISRAEELEDRVERIEDHERALADLNDLALRVDENLSRLSNESSYIDDVGSRLTDVKEKFAALAEKDTARFDAFTIEMTKRFKNDLHELSMGIDEASQQLALYRKDIEALNIEQESEVADRLASFQDDLKVVEEGFREALREAAEEKGRLEAETSQQLSLFRESIKTLNVDQESEAADRLAAFQGELKNVEEGFREALREAAEERKRLESETSQQLSMFRESIKALNVDQESEVADRLAVFQDELKNIEEGFQEGLRKIAVEGERLEDDAFIALKDKIESRTEHLEDNWRGGMNELKNQVSSTVLEIQQSLSEARIALENWEADSAHRIEQAAGNMKAAEESLTETSRSMSENLVKLRSRLENTIESHETNLLETIENRQIEYRRTIEERFERIEEFIHDMDTVAESLKASQEQMLQDVQSSFTTFDAEMAERRISENSQLEVDAEARRQEMAELERNLDELKTRAYENVSEKLQIFEDDFFISLKNRDSQIKAEMEEWHKNANIELGEMALKGKRDREEVERRYSVELKQKLTELQTRIFGQFGAFQDQVDSFHNSLSGRIQGAEEEFATFREELSDRISQEKGSAMSEFEKVFENFDKEFTEKFVKTNKLVSQKLGDFSRDVETRHRELRGEFDSVKDDTTQWRDRIGIQMDEAQRNTEETLDSLKSEFAAMVSEIRDEYTGRTEQLVLESGEERTALRREMAAVEDSIAQLSTELDEKTSASLSGLTEQSERVLLELQKNSRDVRDELDRKIKDIRQIVQVSRDKAESNRKEMILHTDTEYARLMRNLDEIERRQREFVAETSVFERADEMKELLETDIAELNRQLDVVGSGREEIRRINDQYEKAISLYGEVSGKLTAFLSEQQKVESLEGKIVRISNLSESVELKLNRVIEANDALQEFHVRLKQLEDLHEDLGGRYQRLSEKSKILDAATDGIDQNYERMNQLQDILKNVADKVVPLQDDLTQAEERQLRLEEERERIDAIFAQVVSIDSAIADMDTRLEDLGKAREWLARTETRLEEINRDTQQRIRLLGTLSKRESGGRKSSGSPDMSTREMVVKLAREGWNSDEIATNLKLSRGEVELIMELQPKN